MRRRRGRACRAGRRDHGARERVRGAALHGRGEREQAGRVHAAGRPHRGHARPARRQRARLVQHDRVHARGGLQRVAAADEQAPARARPPLASAGRCAPGAARGLGCCTSPCGGAGRRGGAARQPVSAGGGRRRETRGGGCAAPARPDGCADQDGGGRGQAERAGAGDDEHAARQVRSQQQGARARRRRRARARRYHLPRNSAIAIPGPRRRDKATSRSTALARAELRQAAREGRAAQRLCTGRGRERRGGRAPAAAAAARRLPRRRTWPRRRP